MSQHIDPVCGMQVDPASAAGTFEYEGRVYYFCNSSCLQKFSANPAAYLNKAPQAPAQAAGATRRQSQHSACIDSAAG